MFVALKQVEDRTTIPAPPFPAHIRLQKPCTEWLLAKIRPAQHTGADEIIARLRRQAGLDPRGTLYLAIRPGFAHRRTSSSAQYQYTLQDDDLNELNEWAPSS